MVSGVKKLDFPNRITVELTNDCNLACTFCNHQKINMNMGYMKDELFRKIIDEMSDYLPIKLVPFFRGEPLLHPHILSFIKYAKKRGIGPIQLTSNALLLTEELQDGLIDAGVDFVSFSLDTLDPEIYKCARVNGDLEISSHNVESFCDKCKQGKKRGKKVPTVQVSTINMHPYRENIEQFKNKWLNYADIVRIYEEHDEKGHIVDPDVRKKLIGIDDRRPCRKVFTDMIIYWDGRFAMCNYDWDDRYDFGNANTMSLVDVWNGEQYEKIRDMHLQSVFPNECMCFECQHWKIDYTESGYIGESFRA